MTSELLESQNIWSVSIKASKWDVQSFYVEKLSDCLHNMSTPKIGKYLNSKYQVLLTLVCLCSTHSVTAAQILPLCFRRASLASGLDNVPIVFSSASWPTLEAKVTTVSIMLSQFSFNQATGLASPQWFKATWTSSAVKPFCSASYVCMNERRIYFLKNHLFFSF